MELTSFNPSTGEEVGRVPVTPTAEVHRKIAEARAAQPAWRALGVDGRAAVLRGVEVQIEASADKLAELLTREMGKPLREASSEVRSVAADWNREIDECISAFADETVADEFTRTTLRRDPFGVAAAITPWNFPFSMPHWMVFPSLLAGNTVVLKPSEETPLIAEAYAKLLQAVLPPGVLQVVHGGAEQGAALVSGDVDLIAFTGSAATGKAILGASTQQLKKVLLELGGKDPLLVLEDADVASAARFAASNSFRNAGQVCVSTERVYVHHSVADAFLEGLITAAERMTVADGLDSSSRIGPMISRRQRDKVVSQVKAAVAGGARVVLGGDDLDSDSLFLHPIVLTDVSSNLEVLTEETFGPVVVVQSVASEGEAIALANQHPLQLGASVFGSPERAEAVADQLDAGMVGVNAGMFGAAGTPWVGARQSGNGFHHGVEGHRQFTQLRTISRRLPR